MSVGAKLESFQISLSLFFLLPTSLSHFPHFYKHLLTLILCKGTVFGKKVINIATFFGFLTRSRTLDINAL